MMENCNYDRPEMMVFNMVRQGLFGEILHAAGGYLHDLREHQVRGRGRGTVAPRVGDRSTTATSIPTHGLGPVANCLDINRGDRFEYLVSMSEPVARPAGLRRRALPGRVARKRAEKYVLGDVNATLIHTAQRPDDLRQATTRTCHGRTAGIHMVQGTKGLFEGYPNRVYIEGRSPAHRWEEMAEYL